MRYRKHLLPTLAALALLLLLSLSGCRKSKPLQITGIFPADGAAEVPGDAAVEIIFSEPPERLDEYFTVEPPVQGRFQYMKETVAFLPSGGSEGEWVSETSYTITVKAGVKAKDGKGTLAEDYTFTFTAQKQDALLYKAVNGYETFLPGDHPVLDLGRRFFWSDENAPADGSFLVEVYRLESGEKYRDELYKAAIYRGEPRVDLSGMAPVATFTQTVAELTADAEDPNRPDAYMDIIFPEPLEEGWYVAAATPSWGGQQPIQKLLQIQPSAVYTQKNAQDLLLWYNSTATGQPMSGATLAVYEDPFASDTPEVTATADENGAVTLDTSTLGSWDEDSEEWVGWAAKGRYNTPFLCYSLTGTDGQTYYDVHTSYLWDYSNLPSQVYYSFLYTDRPIYHPTDTVKYWGVVRPRKDAAAVSSLRAELTHNWGSEPVTAQEVSVGAGGIFTGEISYENLSSGVLSLRFYLADDGVPEDWRSLQVCGEELELAQYKKPIYTASITTDRLYYRPGDTIQAQVEVSLFDRTPASGMDMLLSKGYEYEAADHGEPQHLTTGEDGIINAVFPADRGRSDPIWTWHPRELPITARNDAASDVDLSVTEYVYLFPTTIMMETEESHDKNSSTLTVTTNHIDFDKVPGGHQLIQDYEALRGAPAQTEVQVVLRKISFIREQLPPYYDRYTKRSIPRVIYRREEETISSIPYTTGTDGKLVLTDLPVSEELVSYFADVSVSQGGATQETTVCLGNPWGASPYELKGSYHTFHVISSLDSGTGYNCYSAYYAFGETPRYQLMVNGIPVQSGTVLLDRAQNKVVGAPWVSGVSGDVPIGEEVLPDFYLCGAYFDGKRIYPIQPCQVHVDPESRSLELEIIPDREDYQPGDTADVTVKLTDGNGRPVSGGELCLGVVDEAIFAVREQYINMGNDFYGWVFNWIPDVWASYVQHNKNFDYGEGGKGGGGGGEGVTVRENFQDTAAFLTGRTGSDGTAAFQVTMPDDLTQWRLTAVAVDRRTYWGSSKSRLYTTLPFRIDPILSTTFLSGDTIACTVRGFGTAITTEDVVEYTATIEGYSEPLEVTASGPAGKTTPLVFQKLPAGDYTVTVTARCGDYSDGVKKSFTVRDSALTFPIHRSVTLGEEDFSDILPTSWPVELAVYPEGQKSFMTAWQLIRMDDSLRADHRLAVEAVRPTMVGFFGEGYSHPEADISDVQMFWVDSMDAYDSDEATGALRLFPYSGADPRLSARTAVAAPELVNSGQLAGYLYNVWRNAADPTDLAAALMGSAALENFYDDAQQQQLELKARNGGGTVLEDLYLITGVSYLDQAAAQRYYTQRIAPLYKEERGGLYLAANTAYDTVEQTAAALACAVLTGAEEDAEGLLKYLADNALTSFGTLKGPCQLEAALYLLRSQPAQSQPVTVSYTRGGKRETETISQSGCLRMTLTRQDWLSLNLQAEGAAIADVDYTGDPEQMNFTSSRRVIVTKTMDTPEDQKHLGGETTVTIKVELDPAMPYGQYRLVEWVPSNMRLRSVARPDGGGKLGWYYSYRADEQLLTVDFYRNKDSGNSFTLRYTATSVLDTECTLERCYAYCTETMEGGRSEKGDFLPSDYYYLGAGYLFRKQ